jgi:SAM-dependent methyltransferase
MFIRNSLPKLRSSNIDLHTVNGFGQEWAAFDQSQIEGELSIVFDKYFSLVEWSSLPITPKILDVGCGSGRWARLVASRAGELHLLDPSTEALKTAQFNLKGHDNCVFHNVSTESLPGDDSSFDFIYSLGVLHHIPDTQSAIIDCVKKLKPGAPFLVYLYYRFDKKWWFRSLWFVSNIFRSILSRCPFFLKKRLTDFIALLVYFPLARLAKLISRRGRDVSSFPLSFYRDSSLYTMRTDSLDRFGTRLEHRFTKIEVRRMLENAGLIDIRFRESEPFWCAIGHRPLPS